MEQIDTEASPLLRNENKILWVTLNRPKRGNSLDPPTLARLRTALIDAQTDEKVKIIVLTGAGDRDFCTGIDVDAARDLGAENKTNIANIAGDVATLLFSGKPAIVAINGRAMGMGIVFATAADFRLAVEDATMAMPEINVGIYPGASCIALMSRVCGIAWSRRILMSGEIFSTKAMLEAKIVDELLPRADLPTRAKAVAKEWSRKNQTLLNLVKHSIIQGAEIPYMQGLELEAQCADYYRWPDPAQKWAEIQKQYQIQYKLTGNPDALLAEYQKIMKEKETKKTN